MLSLDDLLHFAGFKKMPIEKRRGIIREYIQTLVLFYLQKSILAPRLVFIGGTALRFFYDLQRFSEDLDFNVLGVLKKEDLGKIMKELHREFKNENISMEFSIRKSKETYFHWKVYLQFSNLLQAYGCASKKGGKLHIGEKLSVQMDFQNLGREIYPMEKKMIACFGKRFLFNTAPLDMFLAEKSNAIFFRKEPRARDWFDWMELIGLGAKINLKYMKKRKVNVGNVREYKEKIEKRASTLNFIKLTQQLEPFLFRSEDVEIMKKFPESLSMNRL